MKNKYNFVLDMAVQERITERPTQLNLWYKSARMERELAKNERQRQTVLSFIDKWMPSTPNEKISFKRIAEETGLSATTTRRRCREIIAVEPELRILFGGGAGRPRKY